MEKFPSFSEEAGDREERLSFETLPKSAIEDAQALERNGIFKKLGDKPWVRRFALTLGGLAGAFGMSGEVFGQTPAKTEKTEFSAEASTKATADHVAVFSAFAKLSGERSKGDVEYPGLGKTPEAKARFIREEPGGRSVREVVRTNDFFTMVKKETKKGEKSSWSTQYFFDNGSNGSLDAIVMVGGMVDESLDQSVIIDCLSKPEEIAVLAKGQALRKTDTSVLKSRQVFFLDAIKHNVQCVDFNDGSLDETVDASTSSGMKAIDLLQQSFEMVAGSLRARIDADGSGLKGVPDASVVMPPRK